MAALAAIVVISHAFGDKAFDGINKNSATTTAATSSPDAAVPVTHPLTLKIAPADIIQGEPIMIAVKNATSTEPVMRIAVISRSGKTTTLPFFFYNGAPTAWYGVDSNFPAGSSTVTISLADGSKLTGSFFVHKRGKITESLPIPEQIGGNSSANQTRVSSVISGENAEITAIQASPGPFWSKPFSFPLRTATHVTDPYGYERESGLLNIFHKGVDFQAASGTPVYAINRGVVRLAKTFEVYGNTVIIDHGLAMESFYMHLSHIDVSPGQMIERGQLIGYSGQTGYASGPHLHLSIRINGASIDPMGFLAFF
jgi:murein DD-endopeptidase MepM/ murein hydrolase activator NlpD